jgi:hypothetical protein
MKQPKLNLSKAYSPIFGEALPKADRLRRFGAGLGGLLFAAICVLLPSPAEAQCREWYIGFPWSLQQGDLEVHMSLRQEGKILKGIARYPFRVKVQDNNLDKDSWRTGIRKGVVAGTIDGDNITLDMEWDDGSGGIYKGVLGPTGIIRGTVIVDKNNPSKTWPWVSRQPMPCADKAEKKPKPTASAAPAQPSPKRLISHKGKGRTDAGAPAGVPKIVVFNKPGQAPGTMTVTWDGGLEHPYAEVWVSVDGGDETKVVEQAKGTREVTVEPGKTYQYILTDAGQQLATTSVKAK